MWEGYVATYRLHAKVISLTQVHAELPNLRRYRLLLIDESHNLRHSGGVRFQQLLDWIRSNPKAHVLLVTATPINNSLMDITSQILLGAAGNAEIMKVTTIDEKGQTIQITFHQAVDNLMKKIIPMRFNYLIYYMIIY
jgi:superfamily II DNA or RNA helicase